MDIKKSKRNNKSSAETQQKIINDPTWLSRECTSG